MRCSWFRDHYRQVHMDFHMPEFPGDAIKNFNAKKFVDELEYGKVNMVALFAKCHFGNSFYDTQIGHKHSGLLQDFLMETSTECRKRGIRTLAYYSLCVDKRAYDENPDWRYVDDEGKTHSGTFGSVCMNTPYKDELAMPQLEEIIRNYPVDGIFIDIPFPWGAVDYFCMCKFCQKRWKTELNMDISPSLSTVERQRLNMRIVESWLLEIRNIIDRVNPEMVLCVNLVGSAAVNKRIKELCEIGVCESQPHPGDYLGHSFSSRLGRNDIMDMQVMTVRFYEGWGDMSLKPEAQLTTELAAIIGNGMVPNVGDQVNIDGTLQHPVYETFKNSFGFVEQREKILKDAEPVRHTGILLPVPDPELPFIAGPGSLDKNLNWKEIAPQWRGAHKMLVESHIQTDLLYSVLEDDLSKYPMLILPEPGTYQTGMFQALREYVAQGGLLLAVGNSILEKGACPLEDVFGINYVEPLTFSMGHFKPAKAVKGDTPDIPLQVRGQIFKVIGNGAEELASLYYPVGETQPPVKGFRHPCPPALSQPSPFPFTTINKYGKGRAVYVAASIFEVYWRTNHHWLRQFMETLIRYVDKNQPCHIQASGRIEANLMKSGNDLLLNLIHYNLGHQGGQSAIAGIEYVDPVYNIPCQVTCEKVSGVVLEPEGESLDFSFENGICSFTVPKTEYLSIVRIKTS